MILNVSHRLVRFAYIRNEGLKAKGGSGLGFDYSGLLHAFSRIWCGAPIILGHVGETSFDLLHHKASPILICYFLF